MGFSGLRSPNVLLNDLCSFALLRFKLLLVENCTQLYRVGSSCSFELSHTNIVFLTSFLLTGLDTLFRGLIVLLIISLIPRVKRPAVKHHKLVDALQLLLHRAQPSMCLGHSLGHLVDRRRIHQSTHIHHPERRNGLDVSQVRHHPVRLVGRLDQRPGLLGVVRKVLELPPENELKVVVMPPVVRLFNMLAVHRETGIGQVLLEQGAGLADVDLLALRDRRRHSGVGRVGEVVEAESPQAVLGLVRHGH